MTAFHSGPQTVAAGSSRTAQTGQPFENGRLSPGNGAALLSYGRR